MGWREGLRSVRNVGGRQGSLGLWEPASRASTSLGVAVHGIEVASSSTVVSTRHSFAWWLLSRCLGSHMAALAMPSSTTLTFSINASRLDRSSRKWVRCRPPGILELAYVDVRLCSEVRREQPTRGREGNTFSGEILDGVDGSVGSQKAYCASFRNYTVNFSVG
jgi:hypothetical protein